MTLYERFTMAIQNLEQHGWERYVLGGAGYGFCINGALLTPGELESYITNCCPSIELLYHRGGTLDLCAQVMGFADPIHAARWNNTTCRNKEEVIARLEAARDRLLHEEADRATEVMHANCVLQLG